MNRMVVAVFGKPYHRANRQFQKPANAMGLLGHKSMIALYLCVFIFALGFFVRVDEFRLWKKFPAIFFYDHQPVLANGDGYYYLRMARDLIEDQYTEVDRLKKHPDNVRRAFPPPLISSLVAWLSKIMPFPVEWTAVFFPAIAGPLLIIPLYGLCRIFGGSRVMGITAALFSVLSVQYVYRTRIGFFDTDCLNVTFILIVTCFFILFAYETDARRYLFFISGIFFTGLFVWHWDQVRPIAIVISLYPLAVALLFFYRPSLKEGLIFGLSCVSALALLFYWQGISGITLQISQFMDFSQFVSTDKVGYFPGTLSDIRELKTPNLRETIDYSTGNGIALLFALVGLILLIFKNRKKSLFLVILLSLAGLTFFLGNRFMIFFAPVTALGLGYLFDAIWRHKSASNLVKVCVTGLVISLAWPAYSKDTKNRFTPALMNLWPGVKRIAELTPRDGVIWTTWDAGNPLMYYARRKTISDAQFAEGGERHVYSYMPLADGNVRFSANFIQFFAEKGVRGIHQVYRACHNDPVEGMALIRSVLAVGPHDAQKLLAKELNSQKLLPLFDLATVDQWLQFFFPKASSPAFLFLHQDLTHSQGWFYFGTWDMKSRQGLEPFYRPYAIIKAEKGKYTTSGGILEIDGNESGVFRVNENGSNKKLNLSHVYVQTGPKMTTTHFNNRAKLCFEIYEPGRFGALMNEAMAVSTFNRLFVRHETDSQYFQLREENFPLYQIWRVHGDQL